MGSPRDAGGTRTATLLQVLKLDEDMQQLAKHLQHEGSLLIFGRGYNYATALEAALKVKEVAIMHRSEVCTSDSPK
jgi:glutamine---fructose-6-phosphate transaminase (isomerizing)